MDFGDAQHALAGMKLAWYFKASLALLAGGAHVASRSCRRAPSCAGEVAARGRARSRGRATPRSRRAPRQAWRCLVVGNAEQAEAQHGSRHRTSTGSVPLSGRPLTWLDVFTSRPLSGNGLAVVQDADGLDDVTMQAFARETGLSETTFVQSPTADGADYRNRIWMRTGELPWRPPVARDSGGGGARARRDRSALRAADRPRAAAGQRANRRPERQRDHAPGATRFGPLVDVGEALAPVGLVAGDAHIGDLPPQVVSCGVPQLIVRSAPGARPRSARSAALASLLHPLAPCASTSSPGGRSGRAKGAAFFVDVAGRPRTPRRARQPARRSRTCTRAWPAVGRHPPGPGDGPPVAVALQLGRRARARPRRRRRGRPRQGTVDPRKRQSRAGRGCVRSLLSGQTPARPWGTAGAHGDRTPWKRPVRARHGGLSCVVPCRPRRRLGLRRGIARLVVQLQRNSDGRPSPGPGGCRPTAGPRARAGTRAPAGCRARRGVLGRAGDVDEEAARLCAPAPASQRGGRAHGASGAAARRGPRHRAERGRAPGAGPGRSAAHAAGDTCAGDRRCGRRRPRGRRAPAPRRHRPRAKVWAPGA